MAGDWIKFETTTPDKQEVHDIAATLNLDPDAVVKASGSTFGIPLRECSRRLERERDEAQEVLKNSRQSLAFAIEELDKARQSTLRLDVVNFKLRKERNEAVEEVRRLKIILDLIKKEAQ